MGKKWTYKYNQDIIEVENKAKGETLSVNGNVLDRKTGMTFRSELRGRATQWRRNKS